MKPKKQSPQTPAPAPSPTSHADSAESDQSPPEKSPGYPATDRSAALADGLRHAHRDGDFNDKEYARQMQAITQEAAGIDTRESAG